MYLMTYNFAISIILNFFYWPFGLESRRLVEDSNCLTTLAITVKNMSKMAITLALRWHFCMASRFFLKKKRKKEKDRLFL